MGYEIALDKAWRKLEDISTSDSYSVPLFAEVYEVRLNETVLSNFFIDLYL